MTGIGKKICAAVTAATVTLSQAGLAVSTFADEMGTSAADEIVVTADEITTDDETTDEESTTEEESTTGEEDDGIEYETGDVNNDGVINVNDIIMVASHLKAVQTLSKKERKAADFNGDGRVSFIDLNELCVYVKGIRTSSGGNWTDSLETVDESAVTSEPKKYTHLSNIVTDKKELTFTWTAVSGANGYIVTYTHNGEEIKFPSKPGTNSVTLTTDMIGDDTMVTVRVKPYMYVNTKNQRGIITYLNGYDQSAVFNPDNISSSLSASNIRKSVTLNWSEAKGANAYQVYYNVSGQKETLFTTTAATSCTIQITDDTNYSFRVQPVNKATVNGKTVTAKSSQSVTTSLRTLPYWELAERKLDQVGWDLRSAYNWCTTMYYNSTGLYNDGRSGTDWYANYGFTHGYGNCYVMAACFYQMARMLGYDAHQIQSYTWRNSGYWGDHSWVEIDNFDGSDKTCIFDPDFTVETGRDGYAIIYGTSGTWRYDYYGEYYKRRMN